MTINEATDIVRDYFAKQCENTSMRKLHRFEVIAALEDAASGRIIIRCKHSCLMELREHSHEVAVDANTGSIVALREISHDKPL